MKIKQKNEGITLIALIITIILMLILASVSISMIVNDEIFDYAGQAVEDTEKAKSDEQELVNTAINDYIKPNTGEVIIGHDGETFSKIYTKTAEYTDTEGNTAVIPKGFAVGTSEGINKISTGLVIRDANGNEFVWIPVTEDLVNPYNPRTGFSEPAEISIDESNINTYYENLKLFSYPEDFDYETEYGIMVTQVKQYDGFYIGRYETTIDEKGNIGSKYNTKVLTAEDQFTYNGTSYCYIWYGLYYFQKNANVAGNGDTVQTAMIYDQLWDKTMEYIKTQKTAGMTNYNVDFASEDWHGGKSTVNSGQLNKTTVGVDGAIGDVALNIWDLESNAYEWTQMAYTTDNCERVIRGGRIGSSVGANYFDAEIVDVNFDLIASRLILYIK